MGKKIIAVNAGPQRGWNTDTQQVLTRFVGPTEIFASGDTIYYINTGKSKSHADVKKVKHYLQRNSKNLDLYEFNNALVEREF